MTTEALKRAKEIEDEKAALERFVAGVEKAIVVPAQALPEPLRNHVSAEGLTANLEALIKVWADARFERLTEEFAAL